MLDHHPDTEMVFRPRRADIHPDIDSSILENFDLTYISIIRGPVKSYLP